jgi:hypothetical protein
MNLVKNRSLEDCLISQYQEERSKVCLFNNSVDTDYLRESGISNLDGGMQTMYVDVFKRHITSA